VIQLVVNADDLGLHPAIDQGILEAGADGIVTSATLLSTGRTAEAAVKRARGQGLAVGVHLCLVTGLPPALPASRVPSLLQGDRFRSSWAAFTRDFLLGRVRLAEVHAELRAQLQRARDLGARVDHLDAHQHLHVLPGLARLVREIADSERLPLRWPGERPRRAWLSRPAAGAKAAILSTLSVLARRPARSLRTAGLFESGALDEAALLEVVDALPDGRWELICHPGHDPGVVPEDPGWRYGWTEELAALRSARVRERLRARGVQLTTYGALFDSATNSTCGVV
jgi:predicted glycoside hydrolase/deacetylase ChbG (UPF0249 family)